MPPSWIFVVNALAFILATLERVAGQDNATTKTCSSDADKWALNNLDQSPCEVAQILLGACSADVEPLFDSVSSAGPTEGQENDCSCSTVVYSLVSQCLLCQNDNITTWTTWSSNCTRVFLSTFSETIPDDTSVPAWAYMDVVTNDKYIEQLAIQFATNSDPDTSASSVPTSGASSNRLNSGAIAGIAVGAFVFSAALVMLVLWMIRRRRKSRMAPSAAYLAEYGATGPPPEFERGSKYIPEDQMNLKEPMRYTQRPFSSSSISEKASGSIMYDSPMRVDTGNAEYSSIRMDTSPADNSPLRRVETIDTIPTERTHPVHRSGSIFKEHVM
ncbi:hypothetical protein CPB85DRAFT_304301 [Mucidula mucida]|nr:hypothetical protein CPB85DRAFT_304301 [Mucidula mucida]